MSNTVWAFALVVFLVAMTIGVRLFLRSVFLVILIHSAIWAGALVLISTNLIRYVQPSASAWLILASGLIAFNLGVCAVAVFRNRIQPDIASAPEPGMNVALVNRPTLFIMLALYGVGFVTYLVVISNRFGLGTFLHDPVSIRGQVGESYLASVPLAARILLYLGPLLFAIIGLKSAVIRPLPLPWRLILMAVLAVTMVAMLQRTNILVAVLFLVSALLLQGVRQGKDRAGNSGVGKMTQSRAGAALKKWRTPLAAVAFIVIAGVAFQGVGGALGKTGQQALSTGAVSKELAGTGLTSPFVYYTGGTLAFLTLTDSTNLAWPPTQVDGVDILGEFNPQTWGAATFAPILKAIPGARPFPGIEPFINIGVSTNVYTWFDPLYRDFRIFGVLIGMLITGAVVGGAYTIRVRSPFFFWIAAVLFSGLFLATFASKSGDTMYLSALIYIAILNLISRRSTRLQSEARPTVSSDDVTHLGTHNQSGTLS